MKAIKDGEGKAKLKTVSGDAHRQEAGPGKISSPTPRATSPR